MHMTRICAIIRAMKNQTNRPAFIIAALLASVIAMGGGIWASGALFGPSTLDTESMDVMYMPEGRPLPDFELVSHGNDPFTLDNFRDKWSLVFFGFTNCPDICPPTMLTLAGVSDALAEKGLDGALQTVFVTVDPERDSPEQLAAYVPAFDPRFIGVTGEMDEIDRLARGMGIAHIRHNDNGEDDYMVDHGSSILLVNPAGRLQAVFTSPHRGQRMAGDMEKILTFHGVQ